MDDGDGSVYSEDVRVRLQTTIKRTENMKKEIYKRVDWQTFKREAERMAPRERIWKNVEMDSGYSSPVGYLMTVEGEWITTDARHDSAQRELL